MKTQWNEPRLTPTLNILESNPGGAVFQRIKRNVTPQNLRLSPDGVARILLPGAMKTVTEALPDFGKMLYWTSNKASSICVHQQYQPLIFQEHQRWALDPAGTLAFRASPDISLAAIRRNTTGECTFGIEWDHCDDGVFHRCCLTPESDEEAFAAFIRKSQKLRRGLPGDLEQVGWQASRPRSQIDELIRRKHKTINQNPNVARLTNAGEVIAELRRAQAQSQRLIVTVYAENAMQTERFRLDTFDMSNRWLGLGGGETLFRFCPESVAEFWRVRFRLDGRIVLGYEAYNNRDRMLFAVVPGQSTEKTWRAATAVCSRVN